MSQQIIALFEFQSIKLLKQRLADFKKTLQNEFKGSMNHTNSCLDENPNETGDPDGKVSSLPDKVAATNPLSNHCTDPLAQNRSVVMDEVNFKYLKHVILKFLTCREVSRSIPSERIFTYLEQCSMQTG